MASSKGITESDIEAICSRYVSGESQGVIADSLGVSQSLIGYYLKRRGVQARPTYKLAAERVPAPPSKICSGCGIEKAIDRYYKRPGAIDGYKSQCRDCCNANVAKRMSDPEKRQEYYDRHKTWRDANPEKMVAYNKKRLLSGEIRHNNARQGFSITLGEYERLRQILLWRQGGVCAICATPLDLAHPRTALDHSHASNVIRGVLCHYCNLGIGALFDDADRIRRAADYIENTRPNRPNHAA